MRNGIKGNIKGIQRLTSYLQKFKQKVDEKGLGLKSYNSPDFARNKSITKQVDKLAHNINDPITPLTCSGTSFKCDVSGSGKTPITDTTLYPNSYDYIASDMQEGGLLGKTYQLPILHNWENSTIETKYTKDSLKATYGFENFQ